MYGSKTHRIISRKTISIIIPTLNEEKGIAKVIDEIPINDLGKMGYECEVVVVDGGSKDHTREIAVSKGARVVIESRPGYGRAYKTGFTYARGDILATLDGDFSYPAFLIPRLVENLEEKNLDFVSTNRMENCARESFPALHILGNRVLTSFATLLFRIRLEDSQSGMWIFRRSMLDQINPNSNGMAFSEEIKVLAFKFFRTIEVDVPYRKRLGKQKLRTILDGVQNMSRLFALRLSFVGFRPLSPVLLANLETVRRIKLAAKPNRRSIVPNYLLSKNMVV